MDRALAQDLAWKIMKGDNVLATDFVARGWTFSWDRSKTIFGRCFHHRRMITLSWHLTKLNTEEQVKDTVLHEIAHAICGQGHGHDMTWKLVAQQLGATPKRCSKELPKDVDYKYIAKCQHCGKVYRRNRIKRDRSYSCGNCSPTFDPKFQLVYHLS